MSGSMRASFILKLEDQLTNGLVKLQRVLEATKRAAEAVKMPGLVDIGATMDKATNGAIHLVNALERTTRAADRAQQAMRRMASAAGGAMRSAGERIGVIGGAVAGYSVMRPIHQYADYENMLRHIAITQKMSGPAVEAEVKRLDALLRKDALGTGQNSANLARAYNFLITAGIPAAEVDKLIGAHSRAATAYNVDPDAMGQAVFALHDSFKISAEDMEQVLGAMAIAAKEAHFTVENFSRELPAIGGKMAALGMTGKGGAHMAFAALETIIKNSAIPSEAATNFKDLLDYITAPIAVHSFEKLGHDTPGMMPYREASAALRTAMARGVNLPAILLDAEKRGVDPLTAFLGKLQMMTANMTLAEKKMFLGSVLHNQQARDAALSLLQHSHEFLTLKQMLGSVGKDVIDRDFITAFRAPKVQLNILSEQLEQVNRRLGEGFSPILQWFNRGLLGMREGIEGLDERFPGLVDGALYLTAGLLSLVAVAGVLGVAWGPVAAGFGLLGGLLSATGPVLVGLTMLGGILTALTLTFKNFDTSGSPQAVAGALRSDGLYIPEITDEALAARRGYVPRDERDDDRLSFRQQMQDAGRLIGESAASVIETILRGAQIPGGGIPSPDGGYVFMPPPRGRTTGRE